VRLRAIDGSPEAVAHQVRLLDCERVRYADDLFRPCLQTELDLFRVLGEPEAHNARRDHPELLGQVGNTSPQLA
jgi:hypothetical protein